MRASFVRFTCLQLVLVAAQMGGATGQNLTTYLLTKYADTYQEAISRPSFYQKVLNGTVTYEQVAYFFEQDTIYGRGFTTLCGNTLVQLTKSLTAPTSNRTLTAINNLGETASSLSDEDGKLTSLRDQLDPGSASQPLTPSPGTKSYVHYLSRVSSPPHAPFDAFVCSWTMGKAFVDVWTGIQKNQVNKPNKIPQLQEIIDYWADPSYVAAIDQTGDLINGWWDGQPWPESVDTVFLNTLKHEDDFWVSVDSMGSQ